MHEFALIEQIHKSISNSKRVLRGIGDDTAVLRPPKHKMLMTVDALVEEVHFTRKTFSPEEIGHKALAVNLSDIASMGGVPLYATVSLGVSQHTNARFIEKFYRGLNALAKKYKVDVVGGNLSRSDKFFADITVVGEATKPLLRSGAKAKDLIAVTGFLGTAHLGYHYLSAPPLLKKKKYAPLLVAQITPEPRVMEATALAKVPGIHSMMDISDGLASELNHIATASKKKLIVQERFIPILPLARQYALNHKQKPLEAALYGGEDYELLITLSKASLKRAQKALRKLGSNLVVIGEVKAGMGVYFVKATGKQSKLASKGWRHF